MVERPEKFVGKIVLGQLELNIFADRGEEQKWKEKVNSQE